MSWIKLDDAYLEHPKFRRLLKRRGGADALYLWHGALAWCAQHLTDGVIPADMLDEPRGPSSAKARQRAWDALVQCGLCTRDASAQHANGADAARVQHVLHDYTQYQFSADRVRALRADAAHRKQLSRNRSLEAESQCDSSGSEQGRHTPVTAPRTRDPDPDPNPNPNPVGEGTPHAVGLSLVRRTAHSVTTTMPGPEPTASYLDAALMVGVSSEQAQSTWTHYWAEGLPPRGVQRLEPWLVHKAKERANQLTRARDVPQSRDAPRRYGSKQPNAGLTGFESLEGRNDK